QGWLAQTRISAGHGVAREIYALCRRLPRLAVAGTDVEIQPARRERSAEVWHRPQGTVADRAGKASAGTGASQPGLAAGYGNGRWILSVSLRRAVGRGRFCRPPQLRESMPFA